MAQPLQVRSETSPEFPPTRIEQVRLGIGIELVTILWMTIEASVALLVGLATRSVSLQGFGCE